MKPAFTHTFVLLILFAVLQVTSLYAQSGTLQVYCSAGTAVYLNDKYLGKATEGMHGFLAENIPAGEVKVSIHKNGYDAQTKTVLIKENQVTEVTFDDIKSASQHQKWAGVDLNFGTFGLFNVNSVFTKAEYTAGFTPYFDYQLNKIFSLGAEVMCMWGKPKTADVPRMMICPNVRLNLIFDPYEKVGFNILVASGFSFWPANNSVPHLTPTFNETRTGWDFRAAAGAHFKLSTKLDWNVNFGYWAASSTSDSVVWITHDSMIISAGPRLKF